MTWSGFTESEAFPPRDPILAISETLQESEPLLVPSVATHSVPLAGQDGMGRKTLAPGPSIL